MSKIQKLFAAFLQNQKNQSFRDFETLLHAFRFEYQRTSGSHRIWRHPLIRQSLSIQPKGKDAKDYQVKQFLAMVSEHDLKHSDDCL
jgi:predicted RNA binding protein YcfA (HicA-like mRNA interferase family)